MLRIDSDKRAILSTFLLVAFVLALTTVFYYVDPLQFYQKVGMAILVVLALQHLVERFVNRSKTKRDRGG